MTSWRERLEELTSLGAAHAGVSRLADLAQARSEHLGQFFTPLPIARLMWAVVEQAASDIPDETLSILDNSVGSGRLLHFAVPERHRLFGLDVHQDSMQLLQEEAEKAGFTCEFRACAMEDAAPKDFDVALINPPFSLNLQSPHMKPYPCTRWGRFGPSSGATSDEYALAQALAAAQLVVALLPASTVDALLTSGNELLGDDAKRLRAIYDLSAKAFREEGANVTTAIVVFGPSKSSRPVHRAKVADVAAFVLPAMGVQLEARSWAKPRLRVALPDTEAPAITLPVTGDRQVRVVHSGRKIHLKFKCGFMQARCLNAVYRRVVRSTLEHRLPNGVRFAGQGLLDVECILAAEKPADEWHRLLDTLRGEGADVLVDPGLGNYLKRRIRALKRSTMPFGHWIWQEDAGDQVMATAAVPVALNPKSWVSPVVKAGEQAPLRRVNGAWELEWQGQTRTFTPDEARKVFSFGDCEAGWVQLHPPLQELFPSEAQSLRARARQLGIDQWLNWDYQFEDLIELCLRPRGAVCAWKQGLGKARLAAAIALLLGVRASVIVMPAFLLDEFPDRLDAAGLDRTLWQVIRSPSDIQQLRVINVISYERLRMEMPGTKRTYAAALRRRASLAICDEGEVLANDSSDQSRAVAQLAPRKLFILTGTPIPNYPRDLLNVAAQAVGDGVVGQPYGVYQPMLAAANVRSMEFAERGKAAFADAFCSWVWTTPEFAETLQTGAKREVPKIASLSRYRAWLGPFIKRRLTDEPEVARWVRIPKPDTEIHEIEWDRAHLAHYLRVADEFAHWWKQRNEDRRGGNLIALLARIDAVIQAGNAPQVPSSKGSPSLYRGSLTSKQRWVINRAVELAGTAKVVVYARSPSLLDLMAEEINGCGMDAVVYHGEVSQAARRAGLKRFRHGESNVLLASYGVTRAGLDLYQAKHAILASRSWSDREEDQAIRRLLRPQQRQAVSVDKPHLRGGIDVYQDQLVAWKASAANAGLDWATPISDDQEFFHLDQILGRFVENLASMHKMNARDFREWAKETA
ncbi:MAG: helicase [Burkholderiales bacterium]|nr:helicase [Burkholderiales bacterium]